MFRALDGELANRDRELLEAHLLRCEGCTREMRLLNLPRRIARILPVLEPSPFFYRKLQARLARESQAVTLWQVILGLSRQVVPGMAAITLLLLSIFAYMQLREPRVDVYQAYDRIFNSPDRSHRMVIADQGDITEERVLVALAEEDPDEQPDPDK